MWDCSIWVMLQFCLLDWREKYFTTGENYRPWSSKQCLGMKGVRRKLQDDLIWFAALVETFPISLISVWVGRCQDQHNLLGCKTQIWENLPPAFWYSLFKWSGMARAIGSEHPVDGRGSSEHLKQARTKPHPGLWEERLSPRLCADHSSRSTGPSAGLSSPPGSCSSF